MNDYDSARLSDLLADEEGYERTENLEEADLVAINTSSIRDKAQEKVFSDLGRIREVKKLHPDMRIAVGGCVATQEGDGILKRAPYVDAVFGPQTLHRLPELLRKREKTGRAQVDVSFPEIEKFDHLPVPHAQGATAFVSIMEGCSKYCSYCVVPYTRGEEIYRPLVDVLLEVAQLADQGVREVNPTVLASARMLGATNRQLMRTVYIPSAMSWVFSSLHTSVGMAFVAAVIGEYLGSAEGVGYLILQAETTFDMNTVMAGILVLTAFALVIDRAVTELERRFMRWQPAVK